jgi:hypothetical protein
LQKLSPSLSRVYLGGSCPPNAIPTFNQLNAIRNIQMIFINKANHHFDKERQDNTPIKWLNPHVEGVGNLQYLHLAY